MKSCIFTVILMIVNTFTFSQNINVSQSLFIWTDSVLNKIEKSKTIDSGIINTENIRRLKSYANAAPKNDSLDYYKLKWWIQNYYEQNQCLIRNRSTVIPIQDLNRQKILVISSGTDKSSIFQKTILNYCCADTICIEKTATPEKFNNLIETLKLYDLIILAFHNLNQSERLSFGLTSQSGILAKEVAHQKKTILCIFGTPVSINELQQTDSINSILIAFVDNEISQQTAAQIIFGSIGAKGKLPNNINNKYIKGFGIETKPIQRLKYTLPEELGISSFSIHRKIDSIANESIKKKAMPGCQILAAKNGKVFFLKSYGFQTYDSLIPIKNSDLYDLASVTKVTATLPCLMKLYSDSLIKLDDPISKYFKKFRNTNKDSITFRQALAHQAGLIAWIPFFKVTLDKHQKPKSKYYRPKSELFFKSQCADSLYIKHNYKRKILRTIIKSNIEKQGEYLYSDLSFYIYPEIIKKLTKKRFETYVNDVFFAEIGANSLKFNPLEHYPILSIVPTEFDTFFRKQLIHGYVHDEGAAMLGGISGHAGLFGNANDLAKIWQMYLNYGKYGDIQYIDSSTIRLFTEYQYVSTNNRRALGFDKLNFKNLKSGVASPEASKESYGHSGFTGTFVWVDPQNGLLFVFLSNRVYPTRDNKKLMQLNTRTAIHQTLYDILKQSDTN